MSFWERMQEVINQGIETSKDVLSKAKEKAKDLGEKGILKYDIMKLEKQAEKDFLLLGSKVFEILVEKKQENITKDNKEIKELIEEIQKIQVEIDEKEEEIKNI
ncbi:MAG: hypothetical protein JXB88_26725 [Spirochaetales bacterium]|nr:hypothetical protein [Spirochaetales bacterium]